ncbi:MAG TPA: S8 family peptidase [Fimbriimonadales bacterium]|nr:S8 family peptidase [Fimbriimonadales bacterium]
MNSKLLVASLIASLAVCASAQRYGEYVKDEVLVKFKPGSQISATIANNKLGARVVDYNDAIGFTTIKLPPMVSVPAAVSYYSKLDFVEYAEPNGIVHVTFTPNDPGWGNQWGPKKIKCPEAWDITQGSSSVRIAICDTGIDKDHPDLASKIVLGKNFTSGDANAWDDGFGHGSHTAGIAAAITNNGIGVAGVGFNCSLMAAKVLDNGGSGTWAWVASGITWATDNGADAINLSLGASSGSSTLLNAVNYAWNNNVVIAAAAGNNGNTAAFYPAFYTNCIAVAASNSADGKPSWSTYGSWVEVAAPGQSIYSTWKNNSYVYSDGTSMASPHVAGEAGLLWAHLGTGVSNSIIRSRIEQSADPVGSWVVYGRINCFKALNQGETVKEFAPTGFGTVQGTKRGGNIASLAADDENKLWISSNKPDFTTAKIEWYAETVVSYPGTLTKLEIQLQALTLPADTCDVYLLNFNTGVLDYKGTMSLVSSDTTQTIAVTSGLSDYVVDGYTVAYFAVSGPSLVEMRTDQVIFRTFSQ